MSLQEDPMEQSPTACPRKPTMKCVLPGPRADGTCCEVIPHNRPKGFSVIYRNPGHWDITSYGIRAFRIRGDESVGEVVAFDERVDWQRERMRFSTVDEALLYCARQLMIPRTADAEEGVSKQVAAAKPPEPTIDLLVTGSDVEAVQKNGAVLHQAIKIAKYLKIKTAIEQIEVTPNLRAVLDAMLELIPLPASS